MLPQRDDRGDELLDRVLRSFGDKFFSSSPQDVAAATDKWCIFYSDSKLTRFGVFSALQKRDCSLVYVVGVMDDDASAFAAAKGWEYGGAIETAPEMNRVMNNMRPKLHKIKVDQQDALMVSCFPGYAWTHHVAKMVKTSFPEEYVVNQIFEVDRLKNCRVWDDLKDHFGAGGLKGKRVVIGYVEDVAKQFQQVGESAHWRDSPGGFYRTSIVLQESKYPVVLLGVKHTFWGDIAGVLVCKMYQLGAFEVVHVAKSGSLEHQDFQLRFITQDGFLPYYELWHEKNVASFNVSNEASKVLERRDHLRNRCHTSFFSPLDEDDQSRQKVLNQATSVDIEVSFLAGAIAECNKNGGRQMRFSCIHWISDYLWREKELSLIKFLKDKFDREFLDKYYGNQVDLVSNENEDLKRRAAEFCAFLAKEYLEKEVLETSSNYNFDRDREFFNSLSKMYHKTIVCRKSLFQDYLADASKTFIPRIVFESNARKVGGLRKDLDELQVLPGEDIFQILSKAERVVLWGEALSGKSTLCKWICRSWAKNNEKISKVSEIVWIDLKDAWQRLSESGKTFDGKGESDLVWLILSSWWEKLGLSSIPKMEVLEYLLKAENVLWIWDGWDEIEGVDQLQRLREALTREVPITKRSLITSRITTKERFHNVPFKNHVLLVGALEREKEITSLVGKEGLCQIQNNPKLWLLTNLPFFLEGTCAMLSSIQINGPESSFTQGSALKEILMFMLSKTSKKNDAAHVFQNLCRFAWSNASNESLNCDADVALTGLVTKVPVVFGKERWTWYHSIFQDFFLACFIVKEWKIDDYAEPDKVKRITAEAWLFLCDFFSDVPKQGFAVGVTWANIHHLRRSGMFKSSLFKDNMLMPILLDDSIKGKSLIGLMEILDVCASKDDKTMVASIASSVDVDNLPENHVDTFLRVLHHCRVKDLLHSSAEKLLARLGSNKCWGTYVEVLDWRQMYYVDLNDFDSAEIDARKMLELVESHKLRNKLRVRSLRACGRVLRKKKQFEKALDFYQEALKICTEDDKGTMKREVGEVYRELRDFETSLIHLESALELKTDQLGEQDVSISAILHSFARTHFDRYVFAHIPTDVQAAKRYLELARNIRVPALGTDHRDTRDTLDLLDRVNELIK